MPPINPKPSLFVGSSTKGLDIAQTLEVMLNDVVDVRLWTNGVFGLGDGTLEALMEAADEFDFAILVLTPDDVTESKGASTNSPRDNVVFEAGLFMGRLGRERTFIVRPRGEMKMPSDLAGITVALYSSDAAIEPRAALANAAYEIKSAIRQRGRLGERVPLPEGAIALQLNELIKNVVAASACRHPVFIGEMAAACREWVLSSNHWSRGSIVVRSNYEFFLANVYRVAAASIFSTSIPRYRDAWLRPWGQALVRTQSENANAKSTRVFIFSAESEITATDEEIFQEHADAGIHVRIFVDDGTLPFPPEVGPDWTLVDNGEVVGVTRQFGENFEAEWFFRDATQGARFQVFAENLWQLSRPLGEWIAERQSSRE